MTNVPGGGYIDADDQYHEDECELCGRLGHTIRSCPTRDDVPDEFQ